MNESNISDFYREMGISGQVYHFGQQILEELEGRFKKIDETAEYNQMKVLKACRKTRSAKPVCWEPPDMAIMIWEEKRWRRFMPQFFIRRTLLYARR